MDRSGTNPGTQRPEYERTEANPNQTNGQDQEPLFPPLIDGDSIKKENIVLPPPIIESLFSRGEKLELAGGTKAFKTWSLMNLGLSVANGTPWWGFQTYQNHVVYLNLELPKPYFEKRLFEIADASKLIVPKFFHVIHLRGARLHVAARWEAFLKYLKTLLPRCPNPFLIADPIYKILGGRSENSAGDINSMMDQLEDLVQCTEGSNAFGHHQTKGNQSDKDAIDRSAGSNVFQRDPDTLLMMVKHQIDKAFTVTTYVRNHDPVSEFVVGWDFPLFTRRRELDPEDLKKSAGRTPKYSIDDLLKVLGSQSLKTNDFEKLVRREIGMTASTFFELLKKAHQTNRIHKNFVSQEWETVNQNP